MASNANQWEADLGEPAGPREGRKGLAEGAGQRTRGKVVHWREARPEFIDPPGPINASRYPRISFPTPDPPLLSGLSKSRYSYSQASESSRVGVSPSPCSLSFPYPYPPLSMSLLHLHVVPTAPPHPLQKPTSHPGPAPPTCPCSHPNPWRLVSPCLCLPVSTFPIGSCPYVLPESLCNPVPASPRPPEKHAEPQR